MQKFLLSIFLISFIIAETYSWENEGTIFGSSGNLVDEENVGPTDGVEPYDGDYMLTVSENPTDGSTPEAYIGWVTNLSSGDQVTACFYGYDLTEGGGPSLRIWGHWSSNNSPNDDEQSAGGNDQYTDGTGWSQVCHTWSASNYSALTVQARLYSSGSDANKYFIDKLDITTNSSTAIIHFPGAIEGLVADAGSDQSVDADSVVTLDASGSLNTEGDIVAYFWEQVAGNNVVDLDNEEAITTTFTAPGESDVLTFDLTVYDAEGNESTDSVTITVIGSAGQLFISEIQGETDSSPYAGEMVETTGIVTAVGEYGFFMQDADGPWNGIWIVDFGDAGVSIGDEVIVSGMVEEYYDLTEINISNNGDCSILSSSNELFDSWSMNQSSDFESFESVLVTVSGVCDGPPNEYGEWTLSGIWIDDLMYSFTPVTGQEYTITGPLNYTYGEYKVEPRDGNDIQEGILSNTNLIEKFNILATYPNPFNPKLSLEFLTLETENVKISVYDLIGNKVETLFDGISQANNLYTISWDASNYSSGEYFIQLESDSFYKVQTVTLMK